ncbi:MAG: hypothetical protein C0424_09990 [Sphingobacteriaceae bacterium]|nr:hypothetical protein [Sphingobacteriaceae bacterium]
MQKPRTYTLLSNEWAVPYWLLGLMALLLGIISFLVQRQFPNQAGLFNNGMFVALLLLLSIFYRRLYITRLDAALEGADLVLYYKKWVLPQTVRIPLAEITAIGVEKTEAISGLVSVPEKYWLLVQRGKKKTFLYEQGSSQQVKGLFHVLLQEASQAERLQQILR